MSLASSTASSSDADLVDLRDGAEELLLVGGVVLADAGDDRGLEEVALAAAARHERRAGVDRLLDLRLQPVRRRGRRQRPDRRVARRRVAGLDLGERRGELLDEVVVELVDDDEPLGRVAGLAGVLQPPADGLLDDGVEVVGLEDDERVRAAELEHDLLEVAAGDLGHRGARAARAGERHALHARVADHPLDLLVARVDVDVGVLRARRPRGRSAPWPRPTPGTAARA